MNTKKLLCWFWLAFLPTYNSQAQSSDVDWSVLIREHLGLGEPQKTYIVAEIKSIEIQADTFKINKEKVSEPTTYLHLEIDSVFYTKQGNIPKNIKLHIEWDITWLHWNFNGNFEGKRFFCLTAKKDKAGYHWEGRFLCTLSNEENNEENTNFFMYCKDAYFKDLEPPLLNASYQKWLNTPMQPQEPFIANNCKIVTQFNAKHQLHGDYRIYNLLGQRLVKGQFKNGKAIGQWYVWEPRCQYDGDEISLDTYYSCNLYTPQGGNKGYKMESVEGFFKLKAAGH